MAPPGFAPRSGIGVLGLLVIVLGLAAVTPADPGRWERRAPLLVERSEVAAAVVGDRIYVVGGLTPSGLSDAVEEYDPTQDRSRLRRPLPRPLHHPAAASAEGRLYVIGGYTAHPLLGIWNPVAAVYEYDPQTDRWRERSPMPTSRGALAAVSLDGRIYAVGGRAVANTGALEVYDPRTDRWERLAPMPTPRDHIAAAVVNGRIYVFGGRAVGVRGNIATTEVYDPRTNRWERRAPMPTPRSGIGAAAVGGRVYVMGGELGRPDTYPENEEYDPALDQWTPRAPMPTPRHGLGVVAYEGRIYALAGGRRPGASYSNANEVYTPPR
jgi:N-acetylneuraminic acid mutarotase